jgi:ankyrin repeat protein
MDDPRGWDPEAVRREVEADPAAVHRVDEHGDAPLTTAASTGDEGLVAFLLERGADPNVATADGYSPLLWAVEAEEEGSTAVLARLIAAGADLHREGFNGWTPLHMAASRGRAEKCRLLLDAGAEIDRRATVDGYRTPLMEASASGAAEVVRLLLDRGADASLRDEMFGKTPRDLAQEAGRGCDPGVYRYLKENPIKIDPAESLAGVEFPDEETRARMHAMLENHDFAESYREGADRIAAEGRHEEVIRMLDEHETRRGWRRWLRFGK